MTSHWKVRYYANVLTVLDVDAELPPRETLYAAMLQERLGLSDKQAVEGFMVARQSPPDIYIHDTEITNERNLVDMLVAKKLDGGVTEEEKGVIGEFIRSAEIEDFRVHSLRLESDARFSEVSDELDAQAEAAS